MGLFQIQSLAYGVFPTGWKAGQAFKWDPCMAFTGLAFLVPEKSQFQPDLWWPLCSYYCPEVPKGFWLNLFFFSPIYFNLFIFGHVRSLLLHVDFL